jgi:hypothetical protein
MALFLELEPGDQVRIGKTTVVRMERKSGQRARLRIQSTDDVDHVKAGGEAAAPTPAEPSAAATAPAAVAPGAPFTRRQP